MDVKPCKTFGFFCEDPNNELHWRQIAINRDLGVDMGDLGDMAHISRMGMDNILMDFDRRTDAGKPSAVYEQLRGFVRDHGAQLVVVDTAAQTFKGNEIIRGQVTSFVNALLKIALEIDGAVILTQHPSNEGLSSGRGTSGSTA